MERTLVIIKPSAVQRGLIGDIMSRIEKKGLMLSGMKMTWLDDELLSVHYAHLKGKSFFQEMKDAMRVCPVLICCVEGIDAVHVVRTMVGATNSRDAHPGTIRGDFSMSIQENLVHASDTVETAEIEIKRFFKEEEICEYVPQIIRSLYAIDEV